MKHELKKIVDDIGEQYGDKLVARGPLHAAAIVAAQIIEECIRRGILQPGPKWKDDA